MKKTILTLVSLLVLLPTSVFAQQTNFRGLVVRLQGQDDFFIDYTYVKPGRSLSGTFILQHEYVETNQPATLYIYASDFELDEDGSTPIEPKNGIAFDSEYSLAKFVSFSDSKVVLERFGDTATITYTIDIPDYVQPGLRYARIFASTADPSIRNATDLIDQTGAGIVSRVSVATLLVSVGDSSDYQNSAELVSTQVVDITGQAGIGGFLFDLTPINLVSKIKNTGNNVLLMGGNVTWHDGDPTKPLEFQKFNEERQRILPNTTRGFQNSWKGGLMYANRKPDGEIEYLWNLQNGPKLDWGRHFVELRAIYKDASGENRILVETIEFWVLPWKAIIVIIVGGAFYIMLKRYNRKPKRSRR